MATTTEVATVPGVGIKTEGTGTRGTIETIETPGTAGEEAGAGTGTEEATMTGSCNSFYKPATVKLRADSFVQSLPVIL